MASRVESSPPVSANADHGTGEKSHSRASVWGGNPIPPLCDNMGAVGRKQLVECAVVGGGERTKWLIGRASLLGIDGSTAGKIQSSGGVLVDEPAAACSCGHWCG